MLNIICVDGVVLVLLLHEHFLAIDLVPILTRRHADHVSVFVGRRHTHRAVLRVQDERPPVSRVSVFEEGHAVSRGREGLMTRICVDVWILQDLQNHMLCSSNTARFSGTKHVWCYGLGMMRNFVH